MALLDRRRLLQTLLGLPLAASEAGRATLRRLLHGEAPAAGPSLNLDEVNATMLTYVQPMVRDNFFKSGPLLTYLRDHHAKHAVKGPPLQQTWYVSEAAVPALQAAEWQLWEDDDDEEAGW